MNLLNALRERALAWVRNASLEQLGALPSEVLLGGSEVAKPVSHPKVVHESSTKRFLKHPRRKANGKDSDVVRPEMAGLKPHTPEYNKKRDALSRRLGLSRRQVSALATGIERAAKRKVTQTK
jgi:hypothetical protein